MVKYGAGVCLHTTRRKEAAPLLRAQVDGRKHVSSVQNSSAVPVVNFKTFNLKQLAGVLHQITLSTKSDLGKKQNILLLYTLLFVLHSSKQGVLKYADV